jgi:dihydrofolate reductase
MEAVMTVFLEMTMTLDGFVAGPGVRMEEPMGDDGERIHDWMFKGKTDREAEASEIEKFADIGAVIIGNTTFELGVGPWGDNPTFHAPCFVVSHKAREAVVKGGGTSYTFVPEGMERALDQARAAAGPKDVMVMGGANIAQQYIKAGLLDEMRIHVAHFLLGAGTRLFENLGAEPMELQWIEAIDEPDVTHLRFRAVT